MRIITLKYVGVYNPYAMHQNRDVTIETRDDGTVTVDFSEEDGHGIDGVGTLAAHFSRAKHSVSIVEGTDSELHRCFDTESKCIRGTYEQFKSISNALREDEKNHAGVGTDKMVNETRRFFNNVVIDEIKNNYR